MSLLTILFSLLTLFLLEIILGIDNLVFLTVLTDSLPKMQRKRARRWGLCFAWVSRLIFLASALWLTQKTHALITIDGLALSLRDVLLLLGGVFLIIKATQEIHRAVEKDNPLKPTHQHKKAPSFYKVVMQIALMDIVFSFDSVLTAVGLTDQFMIMATAISCAILVMIFASEMVAAFIETYQTIKMLALSFLILIGMMLIADGFHFHIPRGYLYFAMGFSLGVEALNIISRNRLKE